MSTTSSRGSAEDGLTLTVLGCGTMGIAILSGILSSLADTTGNGKSNPERSATGTSTASEVAPTRLPSKFIACVRRPESANRIRKALGDYMDKITIKENNNLSAVREADVILLGCKPQMFRDVLNGPDMKQALKGKILISILAGVTAPQIQEHLYGSVAEAENEGCCRIVRALPNTAASVRESMTVIANSTPPLPQQLSALVTWIFTRVGRVTHLPPNMLDVSTALCGSGPAFIALVLEALADGAVAMGLPRAEAQIMAAQAMRGTTGMVLQGEHPAILRDKVSTPGGCTIGGLLVLEEGRVRGSVARGVREATVVASQLGQGVQNVNGTRFPSSNL